MLLLRATEFNMTARLLLFVVALSALAAADIVRITTERRPEDVDYSSEENPMEDVGLDDENAIPEERSEDRVHAHIMAAMRRPDLKRQMGQILPIIRAMSPPQRLTLAALITSQVMDSSPPTLNEVSAMFGIDADAPDHIKRNITSTLLLPISYDIARMFKGRSLAPQAQEYRSFRPPPPPQWGFRRPSSGGNRRNTHVYTAMLPPPPPHARQPPPDLTVAPDEDHCEFFSQSLCLEVTDYPREAILASLVASEGALDDALIPDRMGEEGMVTETADRRQDGGGTHPVSMCSSTTKLARPKRARTTGGEWKYIVNTGHYVQTLRLEMCRNPQESCSYISDNFRSECSQVFNYHRLLTWDEIKGLHMDVFKVPTCCSCQVKGYAVNFPPRVGPNSIQTPHEPHAPRPGPELVVDENFGGSNAQQFENFDFHDPAHLLRRGAGTHTGEIKISMQNSNNLPPHYDRAGQHNGLDRGDHSGLGLGLVPPRGPGPFFDNNIRRSRNQTGYIDRRVYEAPEEGSTPHYQRPPDIVRGVSVGPQPGVHMNPGRRVPAGRPPSRGNPPSAGRLPTLERPPPTSVAVSPTVERTTQVSEPKNEIQTDGKRVNYSYHPIIDFFKARGDTDKLESRSGEGWKPIVGPVT